MITFRTQYSNNVRPVSNAGSRMKKKFLLQFNERGEQCLVEVGQHNLYEEIQSYRESTDLAYILSRLDPEQVNGIVSEDYSAMLSSDVLDVTQLPTNLGDMLNLSKRGEQLFNSLPVQVREEFNFSLHNFLREFGTQNFMERIERLNSKMFPNVSRETIKPKENEKEIEKDVK